MQRAHAVVPMRHMMHRDRDARFLCWASDGRAAVYGEAWPRQAFSVGQCAGTRWGMSKGWGMAGG